jgi:hypothetical protein
MKSTHPLVAIVLFLWCGVGVFASYSQLKEIAWLNAFNRIDIPNRDVALFGADLLAYRQLQATPDTFSIAMLIPHDHYRLKSVLFLYPRQLTFFTDPRILLQSDLESFDAVYAFIPTSNSFGAVAGLHDFALINNWDIDSLYSLEQLSNSPAANSADFETKIFNNHGNLLYLL